MELAEKLRKILKQKYGISTDEELLKALDDMQGLDIGIFTAPLENQKATA